jgi:hypothetical protein
MLNQVGLNIQKHQSRSQMRLHLKNSCETSRCLVGDRRSNVGGDSVIVLIVDAVPPIVDDHIVQNNTITHDQPGSALRVRPANDD